MTVIAVSLVAAVFLGLLVWVGVDLNRWMKRAVTATDGATLAAVVSRSRRFDIADVAGGAIAAATLTALGLGDPGPRATTFAVAGMVLGVVWALNCRWARQGAVRRIARARGFDGKAPTQSSPATGPTSHDREAGTSAAQESPDAPRSSPQQTAARGLRGPGCLIVALASAAAAGLALESVRQNWLPWWLALAGLLVFLAVAGFAGIAAAGASRVTRSRGRRGAD